MRKFMRTRSPAAAARPPDAPPYAAGAGAAPPHANGHALKTNGHANGISTGGLRREDHSTLSRYWSGSEGSCAEAGAGAPLWEDPAFPATWRSIGERSSARGVVWMRPQEVCARPAFRGDDGDDDAASEEFAARWRIEVGELGSGALCAAAAALALTPRLLDRVAPPQPRAKAAGVYRFRFWVFGAWRCVCVDDRLPWRGGRPLASRGALPADFTLPLLEKAYAKLYGSYAAMRRAGGGVARALQDLSGGVVQSFALRRQPRALAAQVLHSAVPRSTLLVATAERDGRRAGLVPGRAYCVTGLARVRGGGAGGGGDGALVRLRAPAGGGAAGGAADWRALSPADRELLESRANAPGEFWMSFEEFVSAFSQLELVHVGPDDWLAEPALRARRPWRAVLARRRWRRGATAGGPPGARTAHANPHFHVQVPASETRCHVVVSVTQQYEPAGAGRGAPLAVGFAVYAVPAGWRARRAAAPPAPPLDVTHAAAAREVATFFTLPAGRYLVVPHTRRPHADAAFLLRILTDERTDVWEVNEDNTILRDVLGDAAPPAPDDCGPELDASALRAALARGRCGARAAPASRVCRALVALRDPALRGAAPPAALPALARALEAWRAAWRAGAGSARRVSSYRLGELLEAAGVSVSNKVLEALVLRFARDAALDRDAYLLALATIHLAHERYRCLDAKLKCNPLSLEEMILMTIYS